ASVCKNGADHFLKILVELFDQRGGVRAFGEGGETAYVGEQNGDGPAHTTQGIEISLRIIEEFFDDVLRDVAFEGFSDTAFFEAFEQVIVGERDEAAGY